MKCGLCCERTAFARWRSGGGGWDGPVCKAHLDFWLDGADEDPALEPERLEFLVSLTAAERRRGIPHTWDVHARAWVCSKCSHRWRGPGPCRCICCLLLEGLVR